MSNYWINRQAKELEKVTNRGIKECNAQIKKYYRRCMKKVIADFEATYEKLLNTIEQGKEATPADLYKLDKYWKMQANLNAELQKLGDNSLNRLSADFIKEYEDIYNTIALDSGVYSNLSIEKTRQVVNGIWCTDGKSWSQRVWNNTDKLQTALNDNLIHCVVTGKTTRELRNLLSHSFGVSYSRANTLINTEMTRIQVQAARDRYTDYGLTYYEILGNEDDTCGNEHGVDCHEYDGKRFLLAEMQVGVNAPPFHPNCRCDIIPIVE